MQIELKVNLRMKPCLLARAMIFLNFHLTILVPFHDTNSLSFSLLITGMTKFFRSHSIDPGENLKLLHNREAFCNSKDAMWCSFESDASESKLLLLCERSPHGGGYLQTPS